MLKATRPFGALIALVLIPTLFAACGYRPLSRSYDLPGLKGAEPLALYMPMWTNNTNEFGLETSVYNTVADWLQGSDYIQLKKRNSEAEYRLNGVIRSIDLTSSRGTVRLTISYALQNNHTGKMIWPETRSVFAKSYLITNDANTTDSERLQALNEIADEIGEKIYVRFLNTMAELHQEKAVPPARTAPSTSTTP